MDAEGASAAIVGSAGSPKRINYNFGPSLVSRAANSIAIALWYHDKVLSQNGYGIWKVEEDRIIAYIDSFDIPHCLKQTIHLSVRPIREQVKHWKTINGHLISGVVNQYQEISWTAMGLIDFAATADKIIRSGKLKPVDAFKLACINCTHTHIFRLWPEVQRHFESITLPDNFDFLPDETIIRWVRHQYILEPEVLFWVYYLKKGSNAPANVVDEPFFHKAYLRSFYEGNVSALHYFFQQTDYYKNIKSFLETSNIMKTLNKHNKIPILLFLLSYMDTELQNQFLKSDPINIVLCLLEWPLHEFFLQVTDEVGTELGEEGFSKVFQTTIQKILQHENEAPLYRSLFMSLWRKTPSALKLPCLREWIDAILTKLFSPKTPNEALVGLFSGTCDVEKLCVSLLYDAETLLDVFIEENKHKVFKTLLKNFISKDSSSVKRFNKAYDKCTEKYLRMYYCM